MSVPDPLDGMFAEARADLPNAESVEVLRTRLALPASAASSTASPAPTAGATSAAGHSGRLLGAAVVVTVLLGGGAYLLLDGAEPSMMRPAPRAAETGRARAAAGPVDIALDEGVDTTTRADPASGGEPPASAEARTGRLPALGRPTEVALIEQARAALATSDFIGARRALARHRGAYPRGLLVEERRSLEVELALRRGLDGEGERLLAAFVQDYPDSAHLLRLGRLATTHSAVVIAPAP